MCLRLLYTFEHNATVTYTTSCEGQFCMIWNKNAFKLRPPPPPIYTPFASKKRASFGGLLKVVATTAFRRWASGQTLNKKNGGTEPTTLNYFLSKTAKQRANDIEPKVASERERERQANKLIWRKMSGTNKHTNFQVLFASVLNVQMKKVL